MEFELQRIERSHEFRASAQLRRLLRYLVEMGAAGQPVDQYRIATEVFGRPKSFDPTVDPIVRVEMRRLRARLAAYYDAHPKLPFRIEIPERSYCAALRPTGTGGAPRIAVLPFSTMSPGLDAAALSDGLADDIIYYLRPDPAVAVLARTSVFGLYAVGMVPREIAERVGADWLLQGTLRASDQGWMVEVVLHRCPTDDNEVWVELWRKQWTCTENMVARMGQIIGDALRLSVVGERTPTPDAVSARIPLPGAYLTHLQAVRLFGRRDRESLARAVDLFEQAIAEDPQFLRPRVGLLETIWVRGLWGFEIKHMEARARQLAAECSRIDLEGADAITAQAVIHVGFEGEWSKALSLLQKAVELEPSNMWSSSLCIAALMCAGRREESLQLTQKALQLDPLSASLHFRRAVLEDHCGFPERAVDLFEDAIEANPDFSLNYFHQAMTLTALGDHAAAMRKIDICMEKTGGSPMMLAIRGHILARMGREADTRAVLNQLDRLAGERLASPLLPALVHCGRNDMESAAEAIRRAIRQGSYCLVPYLTCSMMAPLRAWEGWPGLRDLTNLTGFRLEPRETSPAVELLKVG